MKKYVLFSIIVWVVGLNMYVSATNVYTDYDPTFDNSTSILLEYEITPSISSEDLVEWVHNQSSNHSWAYHVYQLPSFRL